GLDAASVDALGRAAARVEAARYAPRAVPLGGMPADARRGIRGARAAADPRVRWGAVLWPRSGCEQLRAWAGTVRAVARPAWRAPAGSAPGSPARAAPRSTPPATPAPPPPRSRA